MSRLIDADALIAKLKDEMELMIDDGIALIYTQAAINELKRAPTVDATKVIMCCECKNVHYDTLFGEYWCNGKKVKPNHYCGDAKRRQDEID